MVSPHLKVRVRVDEKDEVDGDTRGLVGDGVVELVSYPRRENRLPHSPAGLPERHRQAEQGIHLVLMHILRDELRIFIAYTAPIPPPPHDGPKYFKLTFEGVGMEFEPPVRRVYFYLFIAANVKIKTVHLLQLAESAQRELSKNSTNES